MIRVLWNNSFAELRLAFGRVKGVIWAPEPDDVMMC